MAQHTHLPAISFCCSLHKITISWTPYHQLRNHPIVCRGADYVDILLGGWLCFAWCTLYPMREIYLDEAKQLGKKSFRLQQKKFKFRPITFLPAHWHTKVWWKFHPCMYIPFNSIPTGCCHVIYVIQWEGWFFPVPVRIGLPMTIKRGKIFKFLNQCFERLQCWEKCLKITKPTCWINSCFAWDTFLRPKSCKTLI